MSQSLGFTSSHGSFAASLPASLTPLFSRFPVLQYIEQCGLPLVHVRGKPSLEQLGKLQYTVNWPKFHNLRRHPGVRLLTKVVSPGSANDLARLAKTCQSSLLSVYIFILLCPSSHIFLKPDLRQFTEDKQQQQSPAEGEFDRFLYLPCKDLLSYDEDDKYFLANIQNEDDFIRIMQQFVLGTISELVRIMERLPIKSPLAQNLKFKVANRLCPAHHARWDLFTLVSRIIRLMKYVRMDKLIALSDVL